MSTDHLFDIISWCAVVACLHTVSTNADRSILLVSGEQLGHCWSAVPADHIDKCADSFQSYR